MAHCCGVRVRGGCMVLRVAGPRADDGRADGSDTGGNRELAGRRDYRGQLPATPDATDPSGNSGSEPSPQQPVAPAPVHEAPNVQIDCISTDPWSSCSSRRATSRV